MTKAILALQDGTVFRGRSIGADGSAVGEVVFNTAMTGYQEILTDPSYARQLVTLTYPHIGNTGCNPVDMEAPKPMADGLIIRDLPAVASNWRQEQSLEAFLRGHGVVGISDLDTRKLTGILREQGAQHGAIVAGDEPDEAAAIEAARGFPGLKGMDLAREVTTDERYEWSDGGSYSMDDQAFATAEARWHVVAYDYGCKRNILRLLTERGCRVTVVPATTSADEVMALGPDGVFHSNGPGDPEPCDYAVAAIRHLFDKEIPQFGICLGHQLLGIAAGARSMKMKFGHHGANHPVIELATERVLITSQNHGFTIDEDTLPDRVRATHRSLFDGTLQGIELLDVPAFGFQGHPEASPGPHDVRGLFDRFVTMLEERTSQAA